MLCVRGLCGFILTEEFEIVYDDLPQLSKKSYLQNSVQLVSHQPPTNLEAFLVHILQPVPKKWVKIEMGRHAFYSQCCFVVFN